LTRSPFPDVPPLSVNLSSARGGKKVTRYSGNEGERGTLAELTDRELLDAFPGSSFMADDDPGDPNVVRWTFDVEDRNR